MNTSSARSIYKSNAAHTATKERVAVMLAERLAADASQAILALKSQDLAAAHALLVHAQDVVAELSFALDTELCPAGSTLSALYEYITNELAAANIYKDPLRAENARATSADIAAMFRAAVTGSS